MKKLLLALALFALPLDAQIPPGAGPAPPLRSIASTGNSSTANLAAGATFVGTPELTEYTHVLTFVRADQRGETSIEFSPDGVNFNGLLGGGVIKTTANTPDIHQAVIGHRFFRLSWKNTGNSATTSLSIHTSYGQFTHLTNTINGKIGQYADAIVTRPIDFFVESALGKIDGFISVEKFGHNLDIDGAEDITLQGGTYTGFPVPCPAELIEIVSTDADDTVAGSGAQTVTITYLDDAYAEFTETIDLDGQTPVVTAINGCRSSNGFVATAGGSDGVEGTLTARSQTTETNIFWTINGTAGLNQTQVCGLTVPADMDLIFEEIHLRGNRGAGQTFVVSAILDAREFGGVFRARDNYLLTEDYTEERDYRGLSFPPKTDIIIHVVSTSGLNTEITCGFTGELVIQR